MADHHHHSAWASSGGGRHPLLSCALMALVSFVAAGPMVPAADAVVFHVANKCPFPVWPASAPNTGHPVLAGGGFYVPPGKSRRVVAPATWNGRFWARTGCNFTANGIGMGGAATGCLTGDCEGRLACNGSVGAPPATLVEVSLHADPAKGSSFDVSLVDGYNLPVAVSATGGADPSKCAIAGCTKNVNAVCPPELQVTATGTGGKTVVVACKSACLAFGMDAFCCRGAYATPATCRSTVYSRLFKDACPAYYSYAYDTTAATPSGCYAQEYVITFCPSRWGDEPGDRAAGADAGAAQI